MDPNACLERFLSALEDNDSAEAYEAYGDLSTWLRSGGFEPDWSVDSEGAFKSFVRLPRYTSLGSYPLLYSRPGGSEYVCACCASAEGIAPDACDVLWEGEPYDCDECGEPVETAYGSTEIADERSPEDIYDSTE